MSSGQKEQRKKSYVFLKAEAHGHKLDGKEKKSIFSKLGDTVNKNPGAVIGGGIGFAFGGPIGALIGGSIGSMGENLKEEREDSEIQFV